MKKSDQSKRLKRILLKTRWGKRTSSLAGSIRSLQLKDDKQGLIEMKELERIRSEKIKVCKAIIPFLQGTPKIMLRINQRKAENISWMDIDERKHSGNGSLYTNSTTTNILDLVKNTLEEMFHYWFDEEDADLLMEDGWGAWLIEENPEHYGYHNDDWQGITIMDNDWKDPRTPPDSWEEAAVWSRNELIEEYIEQNPEEFKITIDRVKEHLEILESEARPKKKGRPIKDYQTYKVLELFRDAKTNNEYRIVYDVLDLYDLIPQDEKERIEGEQNTNNKASYIKSRLRPIKSKN